MFTARKRRTARTVGGALTLAFAATALPATAHAAPTAPPPPARYTHQRLSWHPCAGASALECAEMTVPRDWHRPQAGKDLTIAVSRHRATVPGRRQGVLMTAAGGPGGKGLLRPKDFAERSPAVAAAYDVVSFDQRGTGESTRPACESEQEFADFFAGDHRDRSPSAIRRVVDRSRHYVRACQRRSGDLLPYLTTEQTVRDMDLYRSLLGEKKIAYYGASYATMIGAYYASVFPERVNRLVLDSNIAFAGTWEEHEKGQPRSFQRRFEQDFLPWLAKNDAVYHYGRTPAKTKATWERRRAALSAHPQDIGPKKVDADQLDSSTMKAIYKAGEGFAPLATALSALEHWDRATPKEKATANMVFQGYLTAGFAAEYFAVTCNDTPWARDMDHWVRHSAEDAAAHPLVGARELAFASVCAAWPPSGAPRVRVTGKGLPATLMLNSLHDPTTYYEGALRAHQKLRGSRLVTVAGGDHGTYRDGSPCVDGIVDRYLLTGRAPAHDTACGTGAAGSQGTVTA